MGQVSAKGIGDQISRGFTAAKKGVVAVKKSIVPVNVLHWGVYPGLAAAVVVVFLLWFLGVSMTSKKEERCTTGEDSRRQCKQETVSRRRNILWYVILAPLVGLIIAGISYRIGFMINNPGLTAGVATGNMVASVFR